MAREIAAIGAVFAGGGAAPTPPPPEALPPVVAVSASPGGGSESPPRDRVELSARSMTIPGPATGGQKKEPQLQLPPQELRAAISR